MFIRNLDLFRTIIVIRDNVEIDENDDWKKDIRYMGKKYSVT